MIWAHKCQSRNFAHPYSTPGSAIAYGSHNPGNPHGLRILIIIDPPQFVHMAAAVPENMLVHWHPLVPG
jgi:hypothetical protein